MTFHPGYQLRWVKRFKDMPHLGEHIGQEELVLQELRKTRTMIGNPGDINFKPSDIWYPVDYKYEWVDVPVEEE